MLPAAQLGIGLYASRPLIQQLHCMITDNVAVLLLNHQVSTQCKANVPYDVLLAFVKQLLSAKKTPGLFDAGRQQPHILIFALIVLLRIQGCNEVIRDTEQIRLYPRHARHDQRNLRTVQQHRIRLVNDDVVHSPQIAILRLVLQILEQIVKGQCIIRGIYDVRRVDFLFLCVAETFAVLLRHANGLAQTHKFVQRRHFRAVAGCQIAVGGHQNAALPAQSIQIQRHCCHQRLALSGFHLCDPPLVQCNASQHLHVIGIFAKDTPRRLPHCRKRLRKELIQRPALSELPSKLIRHALQVGIRHRPHSICVGIHLPQRPLQLIQLEVIPS